MRMHNATYIYLFTKTAFAVVMLDDSNLMNGSLWALKLVYEWMNGVLWPYALVECIPIPLFFLEYPPSTIYSSLRRKKKAAFIHLNEIDSPSLFVWCRLFWCEILSLRGCIISFVLGAGCLHSKVLLSSTGLVKTTIRVQIDVLRFFLYKGRPLLCHKNVGPGFLVFALMLAKNGTNLVHANGGLKLPICAYWWLMN